MKIFKLNKKHIEKHHNILLVSLNYLNLLIQIKFKIERVGKLNFKSLEVNSKLPEKMFKKWVTILFVAKNNKFISTKSLKTNYICDYTKSPYQALHLVIW